MEKFSSTPSQSDISFGCEWLPCAKALSFSSFGVVKGEKGETGFFVFSKYGVLGEENNSGGLISSCTPRIKKNNKVFFISTSLWEVGFQKPEFPREKRDFSVSFRHEFGKTLHS